ncbi:hypothetical protein SNE26_23055 [Mucilaginibacter sp. cycad4]|uniref:hypothetical protein n=1 Tax=Mucilaginibacter sp. cycad4 TaxID=3342096 RepID=UPI002AAAFA86|nr:hypothetical protein [Mucilaginibacter gossypii]WPU98895.1 hypothetical protein SNE26_23055 [Mucilaginibacter gossypii]
MKSLTDFEASLNLEAPISGFSAQLKSLWYDGKGDWHQAHAQVDHLQDQASAWVHAYLHRKEGDLGNADYWYGKARQSRPNLSLREEWERLVLHFLRSDTLNK